MATALLSGAGVMVLLPAVGRDSIVNVLRALLHEASPLHVTLAVLVVATLALAMTVIWMLLVEITRFYFHANHIVSERGVAFTPRFTLTALHLPSDELAPPARAALEACRRDPANVELLVSPNEAARKRIDDQIAAYDGLVDHAPTTDEERAEALLKLAGTRDRSLVDEVAKVEYGMARHVLRIQVIVLRYIKALLVVIATLVATFMMAAAVEPGSTLGSSAERWIAATLVLWAPAVLFVSSSPVRWLGRVLMAEGAARSGLRYDHELTGLERTVSVFSLVVSVGSIACGVVLAGQDISVAARAGLVAVVAVGAVAEVVLYLRARR